MTDSFNLSEIYDKKINFLFGSGASFGLLPTLGLELKGEDGEWQTIETLAKIFQDENNVQAEALLFMYYYKECIEPALKFTVEDAIKVETQRKVIDNYSKFLTTLLLVLQRKSERKRCNIFTTNYDGCFVKVADSILKTDKFDFVINDGASGFQSRYIQAKNYSNFVYQSGVFERHRSEIPQINLIPLHGSVYWSKDNEDIRVNYDSTFTQKRLIEFEDSGHLEAFSDILGDKDKKLPDLRAALENMKLDEDAISEFWGQYDSLPIVNPTKWKFHETVFEEHYYQMLRLLSYELEASDTVFITFGFSFADEHILRLVRRSLSNPSLQLFVCCFDKTEAEHMHELFKPYRNVSLIATQSLLDFTAFNENVFAFSTDGKSDDSGSTA